MTNLSPAEVFKAWKSIDPLDVAKELAREAFRLSPTLDHIEFDFVDDDGSPWIMLGFNLTQDEIVNGDDDRITIGNFENAPDGFPDFDEIAMEIRRAYVGGQNSVKITRQELA